MAWFLGPVWTDGEPELVQDLVGRWWRTERHLKRVRLVVDDFGNAVAYEKRCSWCLRWLPASFDHFHSSRHSIGLRAECKSCAGFYERKRYQKNPDRKRETNRAWHARKRDDQEYWERRKQQHLDYHERRRERDPEAYAEWKKELERRHYERMRNDPERWARRLETSRIAYRLRQERDGRDLDEIRSVTVRIGGWKHSRDALPAAPLIPFIDRYIAMRDDIDEETACGQLGVSVRRVYAWRNAEYEGVSFEFADRILMALDLLWFDVWTDEGFEEARRLFEGEEEVAA